MHKPMASPAQRCARARVPAAFNHWRVVVGLDSFEGPAPGAPPVRELQGLPPKRRLLPARSSGLVTAAVGAGSNQAAALETGPQSHSPGAGGSKGGPTSALDPNIRLARAEMPPRRIELRFQP